jgi:hypothetical protein
MKKLTNFFKSTPGKFTIALAVILSIFMLVRNSYRQAKIAELETQLINNDNWGTGLPDGKTWTELAQYLYNLQVTNGTLAGWWA